MKRPVIFKSNHRPLTVKTKLIAYTMLVLIPVILFCLVYQQEAERILKEKAGTLIVETVGLSTSWLDEALSGAVRISSAVSSDSLIRQYILNQQGMLPQYEDVIFTREAANRLTEILNTETRVTSVWIYLPEQKRVLSTEYGFYSVESGFLPMKWLNDKILKDEMQAWIFPTDQVKGAEGLLDLTGLGKTPSQVTFVRVIPGAGTEDNPVYVGTTYDKFTVDSLLQEVSQKTKSSIFLMDQSNQLVNRIGQEDGVHDLKLAGRNESYIFDEKNLWTYSTSELTGWKIVARAPIKNYMGGLSLLNGLIYSFLFIVIVLSLISVRALTKGFHSPLKQLLNTFKRFEEGDLTARMAYEKPDEFGLVADSFNQMASTQEHLITTVYEERIAKQQAELNFLSSQINPHFLYNTLAALYSMAKKVDSTLATALISMSRLFRFSLSDGKDMITIKESIEHIQYYIHLLNIRNPGKYVLDLYAEPEAMDFVIPKLIIQPLVENSVKHGIKPFQKRGVISISVTALSSHLLIMVSDNGIGMSKEELTKLRNKLKSNAPYEQPYTSDGTAGTGYALINIYKRLHLKYDGNFQFTIDSSPGKGTTVTYRLNKEEKQ